MTPEYEFIICFTTVFSLFLFGLLWHDESSR